VPEDANQNDLFGDKTTRELVLRDAEPWLPLERLSKEKEAIGFFVSGHPLDEYEAVLKQEGILTWAEFSARATKGATSARLAGTVSSRQERTSARGNRYAFIGLSDQTGQYEAIVFAELLASHSEELTPGTNVLVDIEAEAGAEALRARIKSVELLSALAGRSQSGLRVFIDNTASLEELRAGMANEGNGEVRLVLRLPDVGSEVEMEMPGRYDISASGRGALSVIEGVSSVEPIMPEKPRSSARSARGAALSLAKS
jgi:DNA polymerase-3 subunit alpha